MADLVSAFESLKFKDVRTYVQSGNIVFDASESETGKITSMIEKRLQKTFGFKIPAVVRTGNDLSTIVSENPFLSGNTKIEYLYVTFLAQTPDKKTITSLVTPKEKDEEFKIIEKEIFLCLPHGYGRTKLNNNAFEKKLSCIATTRNWKTVNALMAMAGN